MIRIAVAVALLVSVYPTSARAAGAVRLGWDSCTGPITTTVLPGNPAILWASVLGQAQPHLAYQIRVEVSRGTGLMLPDAWRFDAEGCQGLKFIAIDHMSAIPEMSKACPSFKGAAPSVAVKDYSVDPVSGRGRIVCAIAYPGGTNLPNPAQRYYLMRVVFDHTLSTVGATVPGELCGGVEEPVCFLVRQAEWLTTDLVETPWALEQEFVSANDPSFDFCLGGVPARGSTWGLIKAQYRR